MQTPKLETERIILRPLSAADAEEAFRNWTSDPAVARYMNWSLHQSLAETEAWLKAEEENAGKDSNYTWGFVLKGENVLFGSGGFYWNEERQNFELGYNIMQKYWNRGLVTEAVRAITGFAAEELGIKSLFARHAAANPASGRVLEKVGFVYQGDGVYTSFDGQRSFPAREYLLKL